MAQPLIPSTAYADAWIQVDQTENPRFFVNLLDATRARLLERARKSPVQFFAPLALRAGLNVLDVGCGTGDFLRLLAPLVSPGKAVGLDLSETMIAEAVQRSTENAANLSFRVGSALELPFQAETFDRVLATQVLLHLPDPWKALAEMKRVLAPSGLICISEIDWGTLVVQTSDNELGRRFSDLACRELRNGLIIRELPGELRKLGFNHIVILPEVEVAQERDTLYTWFVEPSLKHFKRIGAFSEAEAEAFLADLNERADRGSYFSSRTYYTILASQSS
ncbi:MAG TPA: methyltransferase domain-containing protein [Candidatus Sulfotelmatobacter sp.]|nr:methyltransferase domain-containing protein [Candidatus Sulfotelmatobacter sp.]